MWRRSVLAAVSVATLLAGCATVPTSGPVREHESGGQQIESGVRVAPVPPVRDASPMLIVEGFLHAMGTDQADFAIARQYLTPDAAAAWRPEVGTTIYAEGYQPRESDTGTVEQPVIILEPVLTGLLDELGEFHQDSGGHRHDFGVELQQDGQWRISHPPKGLLISRYHFQNNYRAQNLHFTDQAGSILVPSPRYFAENALDPQVLVDAQLAGPGKWLAPAVRSAPWSRSLIADVELLPQGVAVLHLAPSAATLTDQQRRMLMAEFTTTLTELPEVAGVQFSLGSTLLQLPGSTTVTLTGQQFADLAPVGPGGGELLTVREGVARSISQQGEWTEREPVSAPSALGTIAARSDLAETAAVNPERTILAVARQETDAEQVLLEGDRLLRPDYSRHHELWAIGGNAGADGFTVFSADEHEPIPVTVDGVPEDPVRAFRLSPDGARIALVLDGPRVDGIVVEQVGVARIVRGDEGITIEAFRPITVSPPAEAVRSVLDVGWNSATELQVLVSNRVTSRVIEVDQDSAKAEDIGPTEVAGLTELAVAPGTPTVLRGEEGVYRFEGAFNWELTDLQADAVTYS